VTGRRVLGLGCGAGQLAHDLASAGAAEVVGWRLDRYADEGAREETWFVPGVRKARASAGAGRATPARVPARPRFSSALRRPAPPRETAVLCCAA
jgi:hypothetical protein